MGQFTSNLLTRDVERSADFYKALTGLHEVRRGGAFVLLGALGAPDVQLCLIDWVSELVPRAARGMVEGGYLTLATTDVAAAVDVARTYGVEIIEETPAGDDTPAQAIIRDIDGRVVELVTPAAHLIQPPHDTVG